jgi:SWIM zinc finger
VNDIIDKPEKPSSVDGLTRSERQRLYDPEAYGIFQDSEGTFFAIHAEVNAEFSAVKSNAAGVLFVTSNTGSEQTVDYPNRACTCRDFEERAKVEQRPCKHLAAVIAIAKFCDERKRSRRLRRAEEQAADFRSSNPSKWANRVGDAVAWIDAARRIAQVVSEEVTP